MAHDLVTFWNRLIAPSANIHADERQHAQLLNTLLLLMAGMGAAVAAVYFVLVPGTMPAFIVALSALGLMAGAYALSRLGRFREGAFVASMVTALGANALLLMNPTSYPAYILLLIPVLLAGVFLPVPSAAVVLVLSGVFPLAVSELVRGTHVPVELPMLGAVWTVAVLMLLTLRYRLHVQKNHLQHVQQSEQDDLRAMAQSVSDGIMVLQDGRCVYVNPGISNLLGYSSERLHTLGIRDIVDPPEYSRVALYYQHRLAGKPAPVHYETRVIDHQGTRIPAEITVNMTLWDSRPAGIVVLRDIRERKAAEAATRKLSGALEQTGDAVMIADRQGMIEYVNPAFERMTGYRRADITGRPARIFKAGKYSDDFHQRLWDTLLRGEPFSEVIASKRRDGTHYYEDLTVAPLRDETGEVVHFVATGRDITERVETQQRLDHMAHHDGLTGLANRALFTTRLQQAIARAQRHKRLLAVMLLDLDRFKHINDSLGHDVGDRLLVELAHRVTPILRTEDTFARFGGDEFAILFDDIGSSNHAVQLAQKILAALEQPLLLGGTELYITGSIGISLFPDDGDDVTTLMKHADVAMYHVKESGRNSYQFYSADMSARIERRQAMEDHLRHALKHDQFQLYFQPIVDLGSRRVTKAEALLRWQHPDLGVIPPDEFLPMMEETGMMDAVGDWALEHACAQARAWRERLGDLPIRVTLNLSANQLNDVGLPDKIAAQLAFNHLGPHHLEVECTELALMQHPETAEQVLRQLSEMGVGLTLDNFGSGYLAIDHLRRFPVGHLKINRALIRDSMVSSDHADLLRAMLALADSLKISVTAVGVENQDQVEWLLKTSCRQAQGHLFGDAAPSDQVRWLM